MQRKQEKGCLISAEIILFDDGECNARECQLKTSIDHEHKVVHLYLSRQVAGSVSPECSLYT